MPVDPDRAVDLFAERLAKLDDIDAIDSLDLQPSREYRKFKAQPDDARAKNLTLTLRGAVEDWLAQLPIERQTHVALVNVECRTATCQILFAENAVDFDAKVMQVNQTAGTSLDQLLFAWMRSPEFMQLHLALAYFETIKQSEYLLYTTYLTRSGD